MSFEFRSLAEFDRRVKALSRKYPSIKNDLAALIDELRSDPHAGTSLGRGCYKVRMRISSQGQGKSGGARVITYVRIAGKVIWMLTIYDKSDKVNVREAEISSLLAQVP